MLAVQSSNALTLHYRNKQVTIFLGTLAITCREEFLERNPENPAMFPKFGLSAISNCEVDFLQKAHSVFTTSRHKLEHLLSTAFKFRSHLKGTIGTIWRGE